MKSKTRTDLNQIANKTRNKIEIHYVNLEDLSDRFLEGNSKKHDVGKIIESIRRYGFRDPMTFDPSLNNKEGGVVEGNGRLEAIAQMKEQSMNCPRGIIKDKDNWLIPVLFGVNATTEQEAIAYSIEHNWSVLWGSDIDFPQVISMFDDSALEEQLRWLDAENSLPITVENNLDELIKNLEEQKNNSSIPDDDEWNFIGEKIPNRDKDKFQQMTFTLSDNQAFLVKEAISQCENKESDENQNKNANAIAFICKLFLENANS